MPTPSNSPSPIDRFLAAVADATIQSSNLWSQESTLDATVPNWRFTRRGADEIVAEYSGWFSTRGRFTELRRHQIDRGEVVEYTLAWEEGGVPHAAHHVHILTVDNERIATDTVMCGGRWPASLLAQMEEAEVVAQH